MKKVILLIMSLLFIVNVFCQEIPVPEKKKDYNYYMQKHKRHKTTRLILLGVGTSMVFVGAVGFSANFEIMGSGGDAQKADIFGIIMSIGIVADIVSIPFFISASSNKKKAASVAITNQNIQLPQPGSYAINKQPVPSLTVMVRF